MYCPELGWKSLYSSRARRPFVAEINTLQYEAFYSDVVWILGISSSSSRLASVPYCYRRS